MLLLIIKLASVPRESNRVAGKVPCNRDGKNVVIFYQRL